MRCAESMKAGPSMYLGNERETMHKEVIPLVRGVSFTEGMSARREGLSQ